MINQKLEHQQSVFLHLFNQTYLLWSGAVGSKDEEDIPKFTIALKNCIEGLRGIIIFKLKSLNSNNKLSEEEKVKKSIMEETMSLCYDLIQYVRRSDTDNAVIAYNKIFSNFKRL
ncbi:MAG: hypothetical protein KJ623_00445 [Nanoarchaeota archaeon]|nr:hypothetical protein [Nanoarchaeota archaeon]MBU0962819.1 hypothetical protein [Nanoarchaeota archaeon]